MGCCGLGLIGFCSLFIPASHGLATSKESRSRPAPVAQNIERIGREAKKITCTFCSSNASMGRGRRGGRPVFQWKWRPAPPPLAACSIRTVLPRFFIVAQGSPQDFAHIGFGQFGPEFDLFGHFIAGQVFTAVCNHFFRRQAGVLFNDKHLDDFP